MPCEWWMLGECWKKKEQVEQLVKKAPANQLLHFMVSVALSIQRFHSFHLISPYSMITTTTDYPTAGR